MASTKPLFYGVLLNLLRAATIPLGFTPFNTISLLLGSNLPKHVAILYMLSLATCSDIIMAEIHGWPAFSSWTFFTYSAYIFIILLGSKLKTKATFKPLMLFTGASCLIFWLWTNLGCWLTSPLYPHNISGFISCYVMALPFLRNSLIGNGCLAILILGLRNEKVNTWWRSLWQKRLCSKIS